MRTVNAGSTKVLALTKTNYAPLPANISSPETIGLLPSFFSSMVSQEVIASPEGTEFFNPSVSPNADDPICFSQYPLERLCLK